MWGPVLVNVCFYLTNTPPKSINNNLVMKSYITNIIIHFLNFYYTLDYVTTDYYDSTDLRNQLLLFSVVIGAVFNLYCYNNKLIQFRIYQLHPSYISQVLVNILYLIYLKINLVQLLLICLFISYKINQKIIKVSKYKLIPFIY